MDQRVMATLLLIVFAAVCLVGPGAAHAGGTDHHTTVKEHGGNHTHDHGDHGDAGWISRVGVLHPIAVHFPIALIITTLLAECLATVYPLPLFTQSARFMLAAGSVAAVPTALLGLAYAYGVSYPPETSGLLWWHRFCGVGVALVAPVLFLVKECTYRGRIPTRAYYFALLVVVAGLVTITGYLGGEMTFGPGHLFR